MLSFSQPAILPSVPFFFVSGLKKAEHFVVVEAVSGFKSFSFNPFYFSQPPNGCGKSYNSVAVGQLDGKKNVDGNSGCIIPVEKSQKTRVTVLGGLLPLPLSVETKVKIYILRRRNSTETLSV